MEIYTKEYLIQELKKIKEQGYILNRRPGNQGGVGNTLEDLLGLEENNLPIPNAAEWELKCQRSNGNSLTTLFHMEPSPRALKIVPSTLLPKYGWKHDKAGIKYPDSEMSFRQTINYLNRTNRGFGIIIDEEERKISISFDSKSVSPIHEEWLSSVERRVGLKEIEPMPYWGFDDLFHKAGTKLGNCFYIKADVKKDGKDEYYHYTDIYILKKFDITLFIKAIKDGKIKIDFDARTGHNHGTKFRMIAQTLPELYDDVIHI